MKATTQRTLLQAAATVLGCILLALLLLVVSLFVTSTPAHAFEENCPLRSPQAVVAVDSEEIHGEFAPAVYAIDGDPLTFWHTQWQEDPETGEGLFPHWIVLDLGQEELICGFRFTPRQDDSPNGAPELAQLSVSNNQVSWVPVWSGELVTVSGDKRAQERPTRWKKARYVRLTTYTEVNLNHWTSAAEIEIGVHSGIWYWCWDNPQQHAIRLRYSVAPDAWDCDDYVDALKASDNCTQTDTPFEDPVPGEIQFLTLRYWNVHGEGPWDHGHLNCEDGSVGIAVWGGGAVFRSPSR